MTGPQVSRVRFDSPVRVQEPPAMPQCNVALFNSADPRGLKIGGIETYTRDYIEFHPQDMNLLFIGPDEIGDLKLDEINEVEFRGRRIGFLAISRLDDSVNKAPDSLGSSETFQFAKLLVRKRGLLRRTLRGGNYSVEVRRVEYAPIIWALGVPVFTMVHVWGDASKPMSGIIGRYPFLRTVTEYIAAAVSKKFFSVNSDMTKMYADRYWPFGQKFDTLTTWANTSMFRAEPFRGPGPLRLVFAGRTDDFKRHDIMMRVMRRVRELGQDIAYHYVGDGDLTRYPEFEAIRDVATLHGRRPAAEVARIIADADIGLLTSEFEGMPRFVIECVASGRPVVALHLPQLEAMFARGPAGTLVARGPDMEEEMARAIVALGADIRAGRVDPAAVATAAAAHAPVTLLNKIWNAHRQIAGLPTREV
jgi:glycosyltransferase involved in cell wall biosynthesis